MAKKQTYRNCYKKILEQTGDKRKAKEYCDIKFRR
jgi:hypothetical protein